MQSRNGRHVIRKRKTWQGVDSSERSRPGIEAWHRENRSELETRRAYAVAMSGKTASILVFSVAALNGLTM